MTDPALTSTRNHQGRPWFGPGAGTPVELRVGPKTTAGHGRGSRRSLINGICYPATRTMRTGTRTVSRLSSGLHGIVIRDQGSCVGWSGWPDGSAPGCGRPPHHHAGGGGRAPNVGNTNFGELNEAKGYDTPRGSAPLTATGRRPHTILSYRLSVGRSVDFIRGWSVVQRASVSFLPAVERLTEGCTVKHDLLRAERARLWVKSGHLQCKMAFPLYARTNKITDQP